MLSFEDFRSSLGIEADLDDGFTLLKCCMMSSRDDFRSSYGTDADLDDRLTFLRLFMMLSWET